MVRLNKVFNRARNVPAQAGASFALTLGLLIGGPAASQPEAAAPARILTNIQQIWNLPQPERARLYPLQIEVVLYYFDKEWNVAWGECGDQPAFLPIGDCPGVFKAGQRLAIEGMVSPLRERLVWDQTRVRVLEEAVPLKAEPLSSLYEQPNEHAKHRVALVGLIDRLMEDPTHLTINLTVGSANATMYVMRSAKGAAHRLREGDFVRVKGVYVPLFDRDASPTQWNLWVASPEDIEVTGSLEHDPRFELPPTPADQIDNNAPTNSLTRVRGVVRSHEPGRWVTLWDDSGQVMVQSRQTFPLRFGDTVEAIGYPYVLGIKQCLHGGLYRRVAGSPQPEPGVERTAAQPPLRLTERVRELGPQEARKHRPVKLQGLVTWSHPNTPFAYVQDASGGIRVMRPKWEAADTSKPGTLVVVSGEVVEGDFVPVITNAVLTRAGYWEIEEGPLVRLEEALTGAQDGRWIQMSGYVRSWTLMTGLARLDLSTSSGEFQVWIPATQSFDSFKGSIVRVTGVCVAVANARHQLTGVEIWAPDIKYLQIEEPAPEDLFAAPLRSLSDLRRFNARTTLTHRVRTSGTVVLHAPGRHLYVQEGEDAMFALSQQPGRLQPGDRVEVVGFPGNQGPRFLLREAVFRRLGKGPEPAPTRLPRAHSVDVRLEGLLARAEGTLLNKAEKDGQARLLIGSQGSTFEATLESAGTELRPRLAELELDSRLAVTGVYEVQADDYGKPAGFVLRMRSPADIRLLQPASWWTWERLFRVLMAAMALSLLALSWSLHSTRKNRLLRQAQAELRTANDQLEQRVQARTHELQEQVQAKERARAELAEAQASLMQASRQAGMAEVATSVLHNVGNVLNSVNVSAAVLHERLSQSRVENVGKAAALLRQPPAQLTQFLTEDPKGKKLPAYLEQLGQSLSRENAGLLKEVDSLSKNIEHINFIVAMQQSHAKAGSLTEKLEPKDLLEHALRIQNASLARLGVEIVREDAGVPRVLADHHKVVQILVNLISNAQNALRHQPGVKRLTLGLSAPSPQKVRIQVRDNGVGIPPENLERIFSQGFTTRQDGHGFGLHSGANAAKEMGGSLSAQSDGAGKGAIFTLELPAADR